MKRILICAIAIIVAVAFASSLMAYPNLTQKTGKPCTYCHKNPSGGKQLTSAGEYYKKNNKLPPAQAKPAAKPAAKPGTKTTAKPATKPTTKTTAKPAAKAPAKKPTAKAGAGKGPSTKTRAKYYAPLGAAPLK